MDISQILKRKQKKLTLNKQVKLIQLMSSLLSSGFHLGEVVDFLARSHLTDREFVEKMQTGLASGESLAGILESLHFSKNVVTQVALVDFHGNLTQTLELIENNLRQSLTVKKKLVSVATYPVILVLFLVAIMFGLKNYLLPQLDSRGNIATTIINHLPSIFLVGTASIIIVTFLVSWAFKRNSALKNYRLLVRIPFVQSFIRLYMTAYFAREWGNLMAQAVELRQILEIMSEQKSRIFCELGEKMGNELNSGKSFYDTVKHTHIFMPELSLIIEYGEIKDKLGTELTVYAQECWEQFFEKINRTMQWIQPLVFVFVALMIVLLYVAMLLPIYSNMGTMIK
nr:competence type IV pilus assembly protein ComGB [Lactococcus nasutitermitis]